VLSARTLVVPGSRSVLSIREIRRAGGISLFSEVPQLGSFFLLPGVGLVPLQLSPDGDTKLSLVRCSDDAEGPLWTPFDPKNPAHADAPTWDITADTGAQVSCVGADYAARLARKTGPPRAGMAVVALCGTRNPVLSAGDLRILVPRDERLASLDLAALFSAAAPFHATVDHVGPAPVDPWVHLATLDTADDAALWLAGPHDSKVTWPPPCRPTAARDHAGLLHTAPAHEGQRKCAGTPIKTYERLSSCLNTTDQTLLAAYGNLAHGVDLPATLPSVLPDDSLKLKAFGRAPVTRHSTNRISSQILEQYLPGDCWFLDLGAPHEADFDGNRFSRLGIDYTTGYAQLTVGSTAGTTSLLDQLDAITSLARQRAGRSPCMFRMDFGTEAAVQGRGDRCITSGLVEWMNAHPGCRIVPNGPYAPAWNRAEQTWQRIHGLAFINHQRAHLGPAAWSMMERAAVWQYNRHTAAAEPGEHPIARPLTRLELFTGQTFDASLVLGFAGQGCWIHRPDGKASAGRPQVSACLYLYPAENAVGHIVLLLSSLHLHVVRHATMLHGVDELLADFARSALHEPRGALTELDADTYHARLGRLLASADLIQDTSVVQYDITTGLPRRVFALVPSLDSNGQLHISPQAVLDVNTPAPATPAPQQPGGFTPLSEYGTVTSQLVRSLAGTCGLRFQPNGKAPRDGTTPSASRLRYLQYRDATTIDAYWAAHPLRSFARGDLLNDLRAGLAEVWSPDVILPPVAPSVLTLTLGSALPQRRTDDCIAATRLQDSSPGLALDHCDRMDLLDGTYGRGLDSPTDPSVALVLGDERSHVPAHHVGLPALRAATALDYDDANPAEHDGLAFTNISPVDPGAARDVGQTLSDARRLHHDVPTSVRQALRHPDSDIPGGWREVIQKEIRRVEHFDAWKLVPAATYHAAKRTLGPHRVSLGFVVSVLKQKSDPDGKPTVRKGRVTLSDPSSADVPVESYSACIDDITDRLVTAVAMHLGLHSDVADVGGAYFWGKPIPASEGGRELYAVVPSWLSAFGNYPTHDSRGRPNYLFMQGNFPGRRDAGPNWQRVYDAFLIGYGMRQSVVDRRLFIKSTGNDTLLLLVHVDDTKLWFSHPHVRTAFLTAWAAKFNEPPATSSLSESFVGIRSRRVGPHTTQLTCVGVIKVIANLMIDYPMPSGRKAYDFPMPQDALRKLRAALPDTDPPTEAQISLARRLAGAIGFVATHVRPDAYFAFCVISKYMGPRLTSYAFKLTLRLGHYLVGTMHLPLVISSDPKHGAPGSPGSFELFCDSSHGNAEDGLSYGGFVLTHNGGGALAWKSRCQARPSDSPGAQELLMGTTAYRWILAQRMLLTDLDLGVAPTAPTTLWTDSQILLDGTHCERLSKDSRWVASRYAMMRFGEAMGIISPQKTAAEDNRGDPFTKPEAGAMFAKHRRMLLGLDYQVEFDEEDSEEGA